MPPLERLTAYIDANRDHVAPDEVRRGCLYGNFSAEASASSEPIRQRVVEIFAEVKAALAYCLRAAAAAGEIGGDIDVEATAAYIVASLQGAILLAKVERNVAPIEGFKQLLFKSVLR